MNPINLKQERGRQIVTYVLMVLTYVPFFVFARLPEMTSSSLVSYFASQLGYLATVMLLWQFILGTRAVTGLFYNDLSWTLKVHKNIGIYGIVLLLAHPLVVAYNYNKGLDYLFIGNLETTYDMHVAMGRMAFMLFLIIWVTSALLRARIGYRPWRYVHYLTYLIMPLVLLHAPEIGTFYAGQTAIQVIWGVMIGVFVVLVALRMRHLFTFSQQSYRLVSKKEVVKGVFLYEMQPLKKQLIPRPGQYIYVRRGFWSEEHPFSVAKYNKKTHTITIIAKVFGGYTKRLSQLTVGDIVLLDGPYGVFTQHLSVDTSQPATFIAGGIGITPFIEHILNDTDQRITLFNANRTQEQVALRSLFKKQLGRRYIDVLSDDKDAQHVEHGYVTVELLQKYLGDSFSTQQFYICGPPAMMRLVKQSLLSSGIDESRIHTEEFGF